MEWEQKIQLSWDGLYANLSGKNRGLAILYLLYNFILFIQTWCLLYNSSQVCSNFLTTYSCKVGQQVVSDMPVALHVFLELRCWAACCHQCKWRVTLHHHQATSLINTFTTVVWISPLFATCCLTGLTHIITMDLHQKEIQGFFGFPVDNLRASPFLIQYIQEEVR